LSLKRLLVTVPYLDGPSSQSLVSIVSEAVETVFVLGSSRRMRAFVLMNVRKRKILFSSPLTRRFLPNILLRHVYAPLYTILLFLTNRIDAILFSQIIDYPLHVMILAKLLRIPILDFIGGLRYYLLRLNVKVSKKLRDKLFFSYGIASLSVAVKLVDRIVLISRHITEERPFRAVHNKLSFAWNFPSPDFYTRFRVRRKYDERKMIVGFVGKLSVLKGILHLIKAIPIVINQFPNVEFLLIGSIDDPTVVEALQKTLEMHRANVKYLRNVPHDHMPPHYNSMMLLVLPSYTEGFPHVVLEALACGTPVLTTKVGEFAEIVEKNAIGFIITSRNSESLANQIVSLLSRKDLLSEVSAHSAVWVRENISYKRAVLMWREIFSRVGC